MMVIKMGFNILSVFYKTKKEPIEYKKDDLRSILNRIKCEISENCRGIAELIDRKGLLWKIMGVQKPSFYGQVGPSEEEIFRIKLTEDGLNGKVPLHYNLFDPKYREIFDKYFKKDKEFYFENDKSILQI
jgi:hypothetical protein